MTETPGLHLTFHLQVTGVDVDVVANDPSVSFDFKVSDGSVPLDLQKLQEYIATVLAQIEPPTLPVYRVTTAWLAVRSQPSAHGNRRLRYESYGTLVTGYADNVSDIHGNIWVRITASGPDEYMALRYSGREKMRLLVPPSS